LPDARSFRDAPAAGDLRSARFLARAPERRAAAQGRAARIPTLSLATVYKNLEALKAIGAVADVNPLHQEGRYEAALPGTGAGRPHHHLVCVSCKKVRDLHDSELDGLRVKNAQGFDVRAVRVQAEGSAPTAGRDPAGCAPSRIDCAFPAIAVPARRRTQ